MDPDQQIKINRVMAVISIVAVLFSAYTVVTAITTTTSTGVVHVKSSVAQATISITQPDHEYEKVGAGEASVRLKPGEYQFTADTDNDRAVKTVVVEAGKATDISLQLKKAPRVPSVDDVTFNGISAFIGSGFSTERVDQLKLDLFRFDTSAETVNIDGGSLSTRPRPTRTEPFITDFSLSIDSKPYKASAALTGLDDLILSIYQPDTGQLLFVSRAGNNADESLHD